MNNLTLVIPAKFEATTLPVVLKEIRKLNLNCKKIVVVPKYDEETLKVLEKSDCEILIQRGEGFGNALIEGLNHSTTEYSCIFNADGSFDPKYLKVPPEHFHCDLSTNVCLVLAKANKIPPNKLALDIKNLAEVMMILS